MYAFFTQGIQRLGREYWGRKIPMPDGTKFDVGLQSFVSELMAALSNKGSIPLPSPMLFTSPGGQGVPSMIIQRTIGANTLDTVKGIDHTGDGTQFITNGFIRFQDEFQNTIDIPGSNGAIMNINGVENNGGGGTGATGSITFVTGVTGSVSVSGCNVTLSINVTTQTVSFQNGLFQG